MLVFIKILNIYINLYILYYLKNHLLIFFYFNINK